MSCCMKLAYSLLSAKCKNGCNIFKTYSIENYTCPDVAITYYITVYQIIPSIQLYLQVIFRHSMVVRIKEHKIAFYSLLLIGVIDKTIQLDQTSVKTDYCRLSHFSVIIIVSSLWSFLRRYLNLHAQHHIYQVCALGRL